MLGWPTECTTPNAIDTATPSASTTDAQRSVCRRRKPRLATSDFQGTSSTIPTPADAGRTRTGRAGCPDSSNASQPLAKATASRTNSERLVSRPDATGVIDLALGPHRRPAATGHLEVSPHPAGFVAPDQGGDPVAAGGRRAEHERRRRAPT